MGLCAGKDFRRANFTAAEMREANFSNVNFLGGYLVKAVAPSCNFTGANLTDTLMDRGVFVDANFTNAVLQRAILTSSDLTGAIVTGADFTDALVDKSQLLKLCRDPNTDGVNPVTGANTRKSLGCGSTRRNASPSRYMTDVRPLARPTHAGRIPLPKVASERFPPLSSSPSPSC